MPERDYEAAVAEFMRKKGVTRCPTVCVVPTHGEVGEKDRAALREYIAAKEAARLEKIRSYQQLVRS